MLDLIDKYFRQDLTEVEQEAMSKLLLESEEACLKFEARAKENYFRYGMPEPEPRWRDSLPPPSSGSSSGPWIWITMVFLGVGSAYFLWAHYHALWPFKALVSQGLASALNPTPHSRVQPAEHLGKRAADLSRADPDKKPVSSPDSATDLASRILDGEPGFSDAAVRRGLLQGQNQADRSSDAGAPPGGEGLAVSGATPVNLDLNPPPSFPTLSVVVSQSQLGFLTAQVVDTKGVPIKLLYRGSLAPGNWMFEWDGKQGDGSSAKPGYYEIEVRSGTYRQHKSIQIQ